MLFVNDLVDVNKTELFGHYKKNWNMDIILF